jgi:predicted nucleic acid-binding protein
MPSRKGTTLWISELPFDKWELPSNDCLHDVRERLALVTLNDLDYLKALEQAAAAGILGGTVYEALIAHCALKANAQTIYTWNIRHFSRLGEKVAARLRQP